MYGFNEPEPWGVWTAQEEAVVTLPVRLQGTVRLRFRAWVPAGQPAGVRIGLGGGEAGFSAPAEPREFDLRLTLREPDDRLVLSSAVTSALPWERRLGVAITNIVITPDPAPAGR